MDRLVSWLQKYLGSKEKYFVETDSLDLDELSGYLKVDSYGTHNGNNNYPVSGSRTLDAFEEKIISFFNKRLSKTNERANRELSKLNTSVAYPSINDVKKKLEAVSNSVNESVEHSTRIKLKEIQEEQNRLKSSLDEYEAFKSRFALQRNPDYPESRFLAFTIVVVFWLLETIMNGGFFAKGSDFGLLGGWLEAGVISLINISTAFLVGTTIVRYVNHTSTKLRVSAWCFIAVYAIASFVFNLFVGHYRDMMGVDATNITQSILPRVLNAPLSIEDIFSWLLVLGGMFFALLALIDGYKSDDPYPSYGDKDRKLNKNRDDYRALLEETAEEIESERNRTINDLEILQKRVMSEMTTISHIRDLKETAKRKYNQQIKATVGQANSILKRYRQHNIMTRKEPAPEYFDKEWKPQINLEVYDPHIIDQAEIDALRETAPVLINASIAEIRNAFNRYLERIHEIEPLFHASTEHE